MSQRDIGSAEDLVAVGFDLDHIQFFKLSAEMDESAEPSDALDEPDPSYGLKFFSEGELLGVRVSTTVNLGVGTAVVDVAAHYRIHEPVNISEEGLLDFANRIAVLALVPYIRQAVADLTQRVFGSAALMPVIRQGELTFGQS